MNDEQKKQLIKYIGFTRTASGPIRQNVFNTPMVTKASQMDVKAIPKNDFASKIKSIIGQTANITGQVIGAAGRFAVNSAIDVGSKAYSTARTFRELQSQPFQAKLYKEMSDRLGEQQDALIRDYKAGKVSREDYLKHLDDFSKGFAEINKQNKHITNGPTPQQRALDVVETAVNVLSFGSLTLTGVTGKELVVATKPGVYKTAGREAINEAIDAGASRLEKKLLESNAFRSLVTRNVEAVAKREAQVLTGETAWQFTQRNIRKIAADMLIKRPVFYESNIGQAQSLYKNILEGDYKGALTDAAWLSVQMIDGGPLGAFKYLSDKGGSVTRKLVRGNESLIDNISAKIGTGSRSQIAEYIAKNPEAEKVWRIIQESNLRASGNKVETAVDNFMSTYSWMDAEQLAKLTPEQITKDIQNWYQADQIIKKYADKFGVSVAESGRLTPVRWDAATRTSVAKAVREAGEDKAAQIAAVEAFGQNPAVGFTENQNLLENIKSIIQNSNSVDEAAKKIQAIDAAVNSPKIPKKVANQLSKLGYTVAEPEAGRAVPSLDYEDTRKLVSGAIKNPDLFDPSAAPQPQMKTIASMFERFGVSPEESNRLAYAKVSESVAANLKTTVAGSELGFKTGEDIARGGEVILSRLQNYVENKAGISGLNKISAGKSALVDIRQMTIGEIQDALKYKVGNGFKKISEQQAKEVRSAILKGYMEVPLEMRGLGDKVTDVLYQYNPLHKYYSRIQSALRYTYNPFFRIQESAETKILSKLKSGNLIWNKSRAELDDAVRVLDDAKIFSGVLPGEAQTDMVIGRITANLTKGQKRDLAGLALDISETLGKDLSQIASENPEVLDDALRVIVQYPRKGALASPLARTLNLVFFPARYNAKVTMVAAQAIAKEPPSVQKAVIHSLFQFRNWLKSDEGIKWQSANADVISLFSWITPINSVTSTLKLLSGNVESWGDLGQLGGLPLGLITQVLDGQGIISLNRPYVDPKTGKVFPDYVPETAKARAATALVDLLNTTFTYPGRIMGLPGKNQLLRGVVNDFIATEGTDFDKRIQTDRLTPLQQNWIRVLKGDTSQEAIDALYNSPDIGEFNGYTLPPYNLPIKPKPPVLPKKQRKTRGKKAKVYARPIGPR